MDELNNRRPIKARGSGWARGLAAALAHAGAAPDLISAASVAVSILGGVLMLGGNTASGAPAVRAAFLISAAVCIQLRLLCNLLDGMVAVEHGRGSPFGPIWNELPDRISDVVLLVAAGYAAAAGGVRFGADVGWLSALLAVLTAYVRELGRDFGFPADYAGPMAKQQRMNVLTGACIVAALEPLWGWRGVSLFIGLLIVALGSAITAVRRTRTVAVRLAERAGGAS